MKKLKREIVFFKLFILTILLTVAVSCSDNASDNVSSGDDDSGSNIDSGIDFDTDTGENISCDDISWGDKWNVGKVIPICKSKGYMDTNGDGLLVRDEIPFDMCDAYKNFYGKKCMVVLEGARL